MTDATPKPWRALPNTPVVDSDIGNVIVCRCGRADEDQAKCSKDRWMADAALIVHAVNEHDRLVAALKAILGQKTRHCNATVERMAFIAHAALAAAREPVPC